MNAQTPQLPEAIQNTLDTINSKIAFLTDLRERLIVFGSDSSLVPAPTSGTSAPVPLTPHFSEVPRPAKKPKTVSTVSRRAPAAKGPKNADMIRAVLPKLKGEFKSEAVKAACIAKFPEHEKKITTGLYYALQFLVEKGELSARREPDSKDWHYSVKANGSSLPSLPSVKSPASRSDLEAKLKSACAQRDAARAAGRDTITEMFQKEIDDLETKLESL